MPSCPVHQKMEPVSKIRKISIMGLGWLGLPLANYLHEKGYKISGSARSLDQLVECSTFPFQVTRILLNTDNILGDWESFIFGAEVLIITIPPAAGNNVETQYPKWIDQVIKQAPSHLKVIFTSTTGVYANNGATVNEQTLPCPATATAKAVKHAEDKLKAYFGKNLAILRLAGLIGKGRHPGQSLAAKRPLRNALAPVNLVHQEDCLAIIERIIEKNCWGQTINACAGEHPVRKDLYTNAARVLGLDPPVFKTSNAADFKIVDNSYSRKILGYEYKFNDPSEIITHAHPGKVMIVGAGPGDKKLLTVKALEAIKAADVILYDHLVPNEIMQLAENSEKHYVGRKFGDQTDQQDRQKRINELLHHHYKQGKNVVRLKCGDPYIYGRAAEEVRYLVEHDIRFEVIPGISAALAAASLNNVPVTERHHSNAVMICTAHTADHSFEQVKEMALLLKAGNTLAIYMASKSLDELIPKLIEACGDDTIPITALSNVSRKNEQVVYSTLKHIKKDIEIQQLSTPIVFLAGAKPIET